jgi:hypothetical protein
MSRRNAPNNRAMEAPSFRVGSHQFTGKVTEMKNEIIVIILLFAIVCSATAIGIAERPGFPEGYVGGTLAPNGDVIGGHPSEEQMAKDRAAAGVSVDGISVINSRIGFYEPVIMEYNPYNPLIQPGSYSNYQMNHPDAIPMPKEQAEQETMGVWITDINGIPLHQTDQIGSFKIFEV